MNKETIFYSKLKGKKLDNFFIQFKKFVMELGEVVIEPLEKDHVVNVFKIQGFYSGVRYRIGYDIKNKMFYATERMFG